MTIVNFNKSDSYDFDTEARYAAVGEACQEGSPEMLSCAVYNLCPYCEALMSQIKARLERAFIAGQRSMQGGEL